MGRYLHGILLVVLLVSLSHICIAKRSKVITVTNENWRETLEGEWMIKFFAPWCPACRAMEEDFKQFADWSDDLNIRVGEVNINEEPGLSGRFIVTALPTVYHAKNGEFRRYTHERSSNAMHKFVEDRTWRGTEPVAWYRHPNSIPMSLMSGLFQTSVLIKGFHEMLTETYGFSTTVAYIIFGLATIATGLFLGLILVFIIDCVSPPKQRAQPVQPSSAVKAEEEEDLEDIGKDSAEEEEEEDRQSTGRESLSGSERGDGDRRGSKSESSEEELESGAQGSQASSQSSSQTSQGWEQIGGTEVAEAEQSLETEKQITDDKEDGQGEVRKRNVAKAEDANKE